MGKAWEDQREEGLKQGRQEGRQEGRITEIVSSVQDGDYGMERGAQKLGISEQEFEKRMQAAGFRVPVSAG